MHNAVAWRTRRPGVPDGPILIPEKRRIIIGQEARGGEWAKGNENCTRVTEPALGGQRGGVWYLIPILCSQMGGAGREE